MNLKNSLAVFNGFMHDFTAGYWLAAIIAIAMLHDMQDKYPTVAPILNKLERNFFWQSIVALVVILATGTGRTFTYVDNYYGQDSENVRRHMLLIKHVVLLIAFGAGYTFVYRMTFH